MESIVLITNKSRMKFSWMMMLTFLITILLILSSVSPVSAMPIPTTSILSVDPGKTVTLRTHSFPKEMDFVVTIGLFGTLGKGGVEVATTNSGEGGSFDVTYDIPDSLKDEKMLSIRLDTGKGIYAYDYFTNKSDGTTTTPSGSTSTSTVASGYYGYPSTSIGNVAADESVTIITYNFPPNRTFTVRMNHFGTIGLNGIEVGTYESGNGDSKEATFNIPDSLKGEAKLAIRFDDSNNYYYAYDWFNNVDGGTTTAYGTGGPYTYTPYTSSVADYGHPLTMIKDVVAGVEVKVSIYDIPDNKVYKVLMNDYGTLGVGGIEVGKLDAGEQDTVVMTFAIPNSLKYNDKIAIRFETADGKSFTHDYFKNE